MIFINKGAKIGLGACIASMSFCAALFLTSDNSEIITVKNDRGKWDIEKFYTEYIESIHENQDGEEEDPPPHPSTGSGSGGGDKKPIEPPKDLDDITAENVEAAIDSDIASGLYSKEDIDYAVALCGESGNYQGAYAVMCAVRNRVEQDKSSYKAVVTAPNQFAGYKSGHVGNYKCNIEVTKAAIAVLRGGESIIGNCRMFFGRVNGHDMWAEPGIPEFYNVGNNVFYQTWGDLHNSKDTKTPGYILIYENATKTWKYPSGTQYKRSF